MADKKTIEKIEELYLKEAKENGNAIVYEWTKVKGDRALMFVCSPTAGTNILQMLDLLSTPGKEVRGHIEALSQLRAKYLKDLEEKENKKDKKDK